MSICDLDLERALVGEALRRYDRFAARGLTLEDFTSSDHVAILEAAERLWAGGKPVNVSTVALELQRAETGPQCGGERGVAELAVGNGKVPDPERLRELRRLRAVFQVASEAAVFARQGDLTSALASLADANQFGQTPGAETRTAKDMAEAVLLSIADPAKGDSKRVFLGMPALDLAVGRLPVGGMMVVAADTGVGKSAFVLSMLVEMASTQTPCGLISSEDPEEVTGARLLGAFSRVSSGEIQRSHHVARPDFISDLERGVEGLAGLGERLLFEDCIGKSDLDVRSSMSRMAARGARLIVVDYIGEISSSERQQDRRNEMRHVAKRLKAHAKRLGVALVVVSQIARPKDTDEFKCPSKHALKESGDITNMAEVIVALWRTHADDRAPVYARVVKCKWGGLGRTWSLQRDEDTGRLTEAARPDSHGPFRPFLEGV